MFDKVKEKVKAVYDKVVAFVVDNKKTLTLLAVLAVVLVVIAVVV